MWLVVPQWSVQTQNIPSTLKVLWTVLEIGMQTEIPVRTRGGCYGGEGASLEMGSFPRGHSVPNCLGLGNSAWFLSVWNSEAVKSVNHRARLPGSKPCLYFLSELLGLCAYFTYHWGATLQLSHRVVVRNGSMWVRCLERCVMEVLLTAMMCWPKCIISSSPQCLLSGRLLSLSTFCRWENRLRDY